MDSAVVARVRSAQPGSPVTSHEAAGKVDSQAIIAQRKMRTGTGDEGAWLDMGDALARAGATQEAVLAMGRAAIAGLEGGAGSIDIASIS